jgi:hypothetical protein
MADDQWSLMVMISSVVISAFCEPCWTPEQPVLPPADVEWRLASDAPNWLVTAARNQDFLIVFQIKKI